MTGSATNDGPTHSTRRPGLPALLAFIAAACTAVGYGLLHDRMHIHYLDDAWTMSFAWTWMREGLAVDRVYRADSALTFGHLQFAIYGTLLDLLGWTRSNALWISTALMFASAMAWYGICRAIEWTKERAWTVALALVLLHKCVEAANLARPDALVLLFISLSLLALIRSRPLLAGLLTMAAIEVHPIGAVALFYQAAWLIHARQSWSSDRRSGVRLLAALAGGLLLGAAAIYMTRPDMFSWQRLTSMAGRAGQVHGPARSEFTWLDRHFKYHSHVELAVFSLAAVAHLVQRSWRRSPLPLLWLVAIGVAALVIRRPNGFYVLMAFPAFVILTVSALRNAAALRVALFILLVSFVIRAGDTWQQRPNYDLDANTSRVVQLVPDDGLAVVGLDDFWFGFRQRRFVPANYAGDFEALDLPGFYLVDSTMKPRGLRKLRKRFGQRYQAEPVATFAGAAGERITIARLRRF